MNSSKDKKININESLSKLEQITRWFDTQKEVDVEVGMAKVKEGAELVRDLEKRLAEIDNEFRELKKNLGIENVEDEA
ncbi:MAG: exodeoxyribonuclease VII small subunit [Patescibacteria group bacterium]